MITNHKRFVLPLGIGIGGALLMTLLYFSIVSIAESPQHALAFFLDEIWLLLPIIIGFGIQTGLYTVLKQGLYLPITNIGPARKLTGASGTTSSIAMVACCAHHVTDVLPILGLTAAATFLAKYQILFMVIGLGTTIIGIIVMVRILLKKRREVLGKQEKQSIITNNKLINQKTKPIFTVLAGLGVVSIGVIVSVTNVGAKTTQSQGLSIEDSSETEAKYPIVLEPVPSDVKLWFAGETLVDDQGAVIVEVTPMHLNMQNRTIYFGIALNTHSVDLGMNLAELSTLSSPEGLNIIGSEWDAPLGGHHVSGVLSFELSEEEMTLLQELDQLTLVIFDVDAPERIFTWTLEN